MGTEELTNRLRRVEGQIRGLQRMVEEHRDCEAILTQLMAARAALDSVGLLIAESYVQECVMEAEVDLARERMDHILATHVPEPLTPSQDRAVERMLSDAREHYRAAGMIDDTVSLMKEVTARGGHATAIVNNRAGGNAPLIAEQIAADFRLS